jgi:hypothetical protein
MRTRTKSATGFNLSRLFFFYSLAGPGRSHTLYFMRARCNYYPGGHEKKNRTGLFSDRRRNILFRSDNVTHTHSIPINRLRCCAQLRNRYARDGMLNGCPDRCGVRQRRRRRRFSVPVKVVLILVTSPKDARSIVFRLNEFRTRFWDSAPDDNRVPPYCPYYVLKVGFPAATGRHVSTGFQQYDWTAAFVFRFSLVRHFTVHARILLWFVVHRSLKTEQVIINNKPTFIGRGGRRRNSLYFEHI